MLSAWCICLLAALQPILLAQGAYNHGPSATIEGGLVIGTTTVLPSATASVNKFLGIPFAQTPPQRFSPPQPPSRSYAPIDATAWKPSCLQAFPYKSAPPAQVSTIAYTMHIQVMPFIYPSLTHRVSRKAKIASILMSMPRRQPQDLEVEP